MTDGEKNQTAEQRNDCEVCKRLIREKHRYDWVWKIACILFATLAVVFAILFFANHKNSDETTVNMDDAQIEASGDDNVIVIGGDCDVSQKDKEND